MQRWMAAALLAGVLLFTGCFGFWFHTPDEVEELRENQQQMKQTLSELGEAVTSNENLLRGLQAQSGSRMEAMVERLSALADELDLALARIGSTGGVAQQDTTAGPDAQLLFDEAYRQFQQGSFEIAAQGFAELHDRFPSSSLGDDALYYQAICWEETGQYHRAIEDLVAVYYLYPDSEWAPGSIFRAADIYGVHRAEAEKERLLDLLLSRYPGSDEAALVREMGSR